jgi:hypothetical protein
LRYIPNTCIFWEHLVDVLGALLVPGALVGKHCYRALKFALFLSKSEPLLVLSYIEHICVWDNLPICCMLYL